MFEILETEEDCVARSAELVASIVRDCERSDEKFTDPEFVAGDVSIGVITYTEDNGEEHLRVPEGIMWLRPEEIVPSNRADRKLDWTVYRDPWPFHVNQAGVGDCWLISAIKTIVRRKELLERMFPKDEAAAKRGIYQVRLCVEGRWQVIVVDDLIPCHFDGRLKFSDSHEKQLFNVLIEKAIAKLYGGYDELDGGSALTAYQLMTGAVARKVSIDGENDVWEALVNAKEEGFFVTANTPTMVEDEVRRQYHQAGLRTDHCYAITAITVQNGHRLVQLHNPCRWTEWKGKWSDWPSWSPFVKKLCTVLGIWERGVFWMEMVDFERWFQSIDICEYRAGFHEIRVAQPSVDEKDLNKAKVLMITVDTACEVAVEARETSKSEFHFNFIVNIHRATLNNRLGELIVSAKAVDQTQTPLTLLEPGNYFLILHVLKHSCKIHGHDYIQPMMWVIRSRLPVVIGSTTIYPFMKCESLHAMIQKYGVVEKVKDGVTVYSWRSTNTLLVLVENRNAMRKFARVKVSVPPEQSRYFEYSETVVPPMSRRIVYQMRSIRLSKSAELSLNISTSYTYLFRIRAFCQVYAELPIV